LLFNSLVYISALGDVPRGFLHSSGVIEMGEAARATKDVELGLCSGCMHLRVGGDAPRCAAFTARIPEVLRALASAESLASRCIYFRPRRDEAHQQEAAR
jgi:hypothetical protein